MVDLDRSEVKCTDLCQCKERQDVDDNDGQSDCIVDRDHDGIVGIAGYCVIIEVEGCKVVVVVGVDVDEGCNISIW